MIKQYVNLPNSAADHYGTSINLVVNADQLDEEGVAYTEWWVEPTGPANMDTKYLSTTARGRVRYATRHHHGTRFRNTLLLPHIGGDRYTVKCSKRGDRSSPVELEEVETWRKIFYSVHYMNDACRDTFNAVKDRFKAAFELAFIELEQVGFDPALVDEPHTLSSDVLPHLYHRRPRLTHRPWHLRIVVLNDIYSIQELSHEFEGIDQIADTWEIQRPFADRTPDDWLISAFAEIESGGPHVNIMQYMHKDDERNFGYDLTGHPTLDAAITAGETIKITIRIRLRRSYLGHSIGNFVCVRINEEGTPESIEQTILQTFTHEVGHGFQQVVERERTYVPASGSFDAWEPNLNWHTNNRGGIGPHCSHNAREVSSERDDGTFSTTSGLTFVSQDLTLCTMFFSDNDFVDTEGKFCENCLPKLKRVNIGRAKMIDQGWADY